MRAVEQKRLVGTAVCSLIALVMWVWAAPHGYLPSNLNVRVLGLRENRLASTIAIFSQETKQKDYRQGAKPEPIGSSLNDVAVRPLLPVAVPDHHLKTAFLDTPQLYKACQLADAIVHSAPDETMKFTGQEFQLAERCMAYITGVLDTLPGKTEIIGGKRYEFAFREPKLLVGNAVHSFNRYVQAHPGSFNWSGAETLAIALVNDNVANWLESSDPQSTTMLTKADEHRIPSKPMR